MTVETLDKAKKNLSSAIANAKLVMETHRTELAEASKQKKTNKSVLSEIGMRYLIKTHTYLTLMLAYRISFAEDKYDSEISEIQAKLIKMR